MRCSRRGREVAEWFDVETSRPGRKARPAAKQAKSKEKSPAEVVEEAPPPEAGKEPEADAPVPAGMDADPAPCASAAPAPNRR